MIKELNIWRVCIIQLRFDYKVNHWFNILELNLISQICKRILKNCYCQSLEIDLIEVLSKLEIFLNSFIQESTNNSEVIFF